MNTPIPIVFAPRVFNIPTPKHASQTPEEIRTAFIALLTASRAAQLAIKQAAEGQCVLIINPSRNPNANQVFHAVLERMIAWHKAQIAAAAPADEPAAEQETDAELLTETEAEPLTEAEPAVIPMSKRAPVQMIEVDPAELAAMNEATEVAEFEAAFMTP